ncbi:MAG: hypothetical protein P8H59_06525 [Flavobacteriales bacterium]|nr:hypothetical protein [Flavobacteriales bacterium]MDG1780585.1 hypothetical protein [Flavobacteriales bacterium]MDG2246386.1 hypothetical protein [Flavobacteriales bacterium]
MRFLATFICLLVVCSAQAQGPAKVEIKQQNDQWTLLKNGEPYYVNGAGGHVRMDVVVECGGNTIRTWGLDNAKQILDEAHSHGLMVMLGLWMAHERHGFDYSDEWAVEDQVIGFTQAVKELKDHPALLLWGVGNEVDLFYSDLNVWTATERIAAMIHEVDPNHPTCAVTAGIDVAEIQLIQSMAPSVDILGINTYGGIDGLSTQIDLYGWTKPYLVTEWGPTGHWEVAKTSWGAPIEESSTEKATAYHNRYLQGIAADKEQCMGSFVFHWGQKQETTPTWYGVFLESGEKTQAIDVLHTVWSGKEPSTKAPEISVYKINGSTKEDGPKLAGGQKVKVELEYSDADNDVTAVDWELLPESTDIKAGGDVEERPDAIAGAVTYSMTSGAATLDVPAVSGPYRLFVYVRDKDGKVATSNIPFWVD